MSAFPTCGSLWLEVVDTNDGKELSNFCKKFEGPLRKALTGAGKLVDDPYKPRLLLTFKSGREVFLGLAQADNSAMWPMGIPRSEEHTSELQSLMRISYAVFCLTKNKK